MIGIKIQQSLGIGRTNDKNQEVEQGPGNRSNETATKSYFSTTAAGIQLPWMLEGFAAGVTLVDIDAHQPADEILGRIADVVPVRRVEFKFT